jgi:hypothetical protein
VTPEEKKLRAKDQRLQKNYLITLETRNKIAAEQDYKCGICGRPENPDAPLNLDHKHFRVEAKRLAGPPPEFPEARWMAIVREFDLLAYAKTKKAAIAEVRAAALPRSVRGLLCPGRYRGCNRRLGNVDDPQWLRAAADYLENPPARKVN